VGPASAGGARSPPEGAPTQESVLPGNPGFIGTQGARG
jgi:hypothetical protein